jgi:hypothetical protein
MSKLVIIASLFALAVPAAFAAPPSGQGNDASAPNPAQLCAEQLKTMGALNFQSLYAPTGNPKSAMGKCISRQAQSAKADADNAAKRCKAERADAGFAAAHGGKSFAEFYGTNANQKNAFGKCVSTLAKQQAEESQQNTLNAAKKCKAERTANPDKFKSDYGTNKNKRNAFGKCVSKLAKEQND